MTKDDKAGHDLGDTKREAKAADELTSLPADKKAMEAIFHAEHEIRGRKRSTVVDEIARTYSVDPRTLERYLKQVGKTTESRLDDHYIRLAYAANALTKNAALLCSYKDEATRMDGNIVDGIKSLWSGSPPSEGQSWITRNHSHLDRMLYAGQPTVDRRYPQEADGHDATCLLSHFNEMFPNVNVEDWRDVGMHNVTQELVDALRFLTDTQNLKYTPECPECKEIRRSAHQ